MAKKETYNKVKSILRALDTGEEEEEDHQAANSGEEDGEEAFDDDSPDRRKPAEGQGGTDMVRGALPPFYYSAPLTTLH